MLFRSAQVKQIEGGAVTLTVRRWKRAQARVGGTYRVRPGVAIEVDAIAQVPFGAISEADARSTGASDRETLRARLSSRTAGRLEDDDLVFRLDGLEVYRLAGRGEDLAEPMFAILNYAKITDDPMEGEWVMEVDWVKHEYRVR